MTENWKTIVGYEGRYEVSDKGNIRSLKFGKTKILKPWKTNRGYLQVKLRKGGIHKNMYVHRLVAEAFIPNPNHLATVNHRDEVKTNNAASNLEWMSLPDNTAYSQSRWAERPIQQFDKQGNLLAAFPSLNEAERVTEIARGNIWSCCNGKLKSTGGYNWRYAQ